MRDNLREQISALADEELTQAEQALLLRRLSADPALRDEWERIHLIRDALHNELPAQRDGALSQRVMAALEQEPTPAPASLDWQHWLRRAAKPLAGLAVAATVAGLAIVGLEHVVGPGPTPQTSPRLASLDTPLEDHVVGTRWDQPQMGSRLNAYLVNHSEYTGSSLQGMMTYVRIAGYDNQGAE